MDMSSPMVLLKAADGGLGLMTWDNLLEHTDLSAWRAEQKLIGMVLPPVRQCLIDGRAWIR